MKVQVKFFAALQEITKHREIALEVPEGSTPAELWEQLCQQYPQMHHFGNSLMISVNMEFVSPQHTLVEGDEVVFVPPVSGGKTDVF